MNYFDELSFAESYSKFSVSECNRPREVLHDSERLSQDMKGLSELDRQYFIRSRELEQLEDSLPEPLHNGMLSKQPRVDLAAVQSEDLNYFDEQLFSVRQDRREAVQINSKRPNQSGKISKNIQTSETSVKEIKIVKPLPRDRPKVASSALEYVRKLRKAEAAGSTAGGMVADPVDSVGVGLAARVAAATATIHTTVQVRRITGFLTAFPFFCVVSRITGTSIKT